ncbi:MAG: carbohydrate ABC transporter permease [Candidatus Faecivicinus sp.]
MKNGRYYKLRRITSTCLWELLLILISFFFILPFVWVTRTAFMKPTQASLYPIQWIPRPVTLENFVKGLDAANFAQFFKNTVLITGLSIIGTVISSSMVAFGFARLQAPGKKALFMLLLSTMMIPGTVTLIPMFVLYSRLHWVDTYIPLVLPCYLGGGAFNIFLLRQFFAAIPKDLSESAMIDGCSWPGIFARIYLPNAKPSLLVVMMFTFANTWNDYFGPMIYLTNPKKYTVALGLTLFKDQYGGTMNMGPLMAMTFLTILPVLALYLFCQKYFVQGVVTSGIKG